MTDTSRGTPRRSLFALIGDIPRLLMDLVRSEIEGLQKELLDKVKHAGVGIGLIATALSFAFFALGVLVAAAVIALAQVLPGWAAALIVAGSLLVIAALLVAIGVQQIKKGTPPTPTKTIDSIKQDVRVLKGTSNSGTGRRAS
ncbi:MAG TPA: phage holin family protein [Rhodoglobus sp.]|nr:phage holin family protein [Rhodoglobus sp.]